MITLINDDNVETRCAALLVLTSIGADDAKVAETAAATLQGRNAVVRDLALGYFEKLHPAGGTSFLLPLLDDPDDSVRHRATVALAGYGAAAVTAAKSRIVDAPRRRLDAIIDLCGMVASVTALDLLFSVMANDDFDTHRAACDQLIAVLPRLDTKTRREVTARSEKLLKTAKGHRTPIVAAAKLFGALGDPKARELLLPLIDREYAHSIRTHALTALSQVLRGQSLQVEEIHALLPLLEEDDEAGILRPTLSLLDEQPLDRSLLPQLNRLAETAPPLVRRFAVQKLGAFDSGAVVKTLIGYLTDDSYARRQQATASLKKSPAARMALMNELLACDDERKAWALAEILLTHDRDWKPSIQEALKKRFESTLEKRDDRLYTAYFALLGYLNSDNATAQTKKRADALRKKGDYAAALKYLTLLKEGAGCDDEVRFARAICELKVRKHGLVAAVRRHDPALEPLQALARTTFPIAERLLREHSIVPEELFFIAFNFAEGSADDKAIATELLEHLAAKHGRTKTGKAAKNKLKLLGYGA